MAVELNAHPNADVVYSDEDKIDEHGQRYRSVLQAGLEPRSLPGRRTWSRTSASCRTERVREVGGFRSGYEGAQDWDLRHAHRRAHVRPTHIRHVPHVLYHWRAVSGIDRAGDRREALRDARRSTAVSPSHFERRGERVEILSVAGLCWRMRYPLPQPRRWCQSIIPTRDHVDAAAPLCRQPARTHAPIRASRSSSSTTSSSDRADARVSLRAARRSRTSRSCATTRPSTIRALNNVGARHARGDVLVLLNNDVEAISPRLARGDGEPGVPSRRSARSARCSTTPTTRIQHAGVILGLGSAGIAAHAYALSAARLRGPERPRAARPRTSRR